VADIKETNSSKPGQTRLVSRSGSPTIRRVGLEQDWRADFFHKLLGASWLNTMLIILAVLVGSNLLFAAGYFFASFVIGPTVVNAAANSFLDHFFFSVQTMATIGYGQMHPVGIFGNILATFEAFYGLMIFALMSGLLFLKFSLPTSNVLFSDVAVVTIRDGKPILMFRLANARGNQIIEGSLNVSLSRWEKTLEGEAVRLIHDISLKRSRTPIFAASWSVLHEIDAASPLWKQTTESLAQSAAEIVITFTGIDETYSQTVHARHSYISNEIRWQHRFVDILKRDEQGLMIDYSKFHQTLPIV
jgi:inward rectifier potassium channel